MVDLNQNRFFQYLSPPADVELIVKPNAISWFNNKGIYCSVPVPNAAMQTLEEAKRDVEEWEQIHGSRKLVFLSVIDPEAKNTKELRDYYAEILPKYIKAMALINHSPLGRMAANIYFGLKPATFPVKLFPNPIEAEEWLQQFI